jgi:hypothetical protein
MLHSYRSAETEKKEFIYRHGERELKADQVLKIWLMKRTWSLMLGSLAAADHGDDREVEAEAVRWATSNKDRRLVQFCPPRGGDVPVWRNSDGNRPNGRSSARRGSWL